ncbi:CBS domain-containing protein [Ectothiorhodospiraceae bacterium WFHF3C12]|nr:CBS domain-containing protein [Ectothiorhodospiraceae bacterium WFHF3C12]
MKVSEAMHRGVEWCGPDTTIPEIAKLFREKDIGAIPIGENDKLIGMVTDRDIVCRGIAEGKDVTALVARDVMSDHIIYCRDEDEVADAVRHMEHMQVRRVPVINASNRMVGILTLGDVSHAVPHELCGEFTEAVSAHH